MPVLKSSCCGCCTIQTGARILGILSLIVYGLQLLSSLGTLFTFASSVDTMFQCTSQTIVTHRVESTHARTYESSFDTQGLQPPPQPNQPHQFGAADYGTPRDPSGMYTPPIPNSDNDLFNLRGIDTTMLQGYSLKLEGAEKDWKQHGLKSMSQLLMPGLEDEDAGKEMKAKPKSDEKKKEDCEKLKKFAKEVGFPILVLVVVDLLYMVISSALLLYGLSRKRRLLLLPWIIGESLSATVIGASLLALLIFFIIMGETIFIAIGVVFGIFALIYLGICIYCILIVVSCYQELGLSHPSVSYSPQQGGMVV